MIMEVYPVLNPSKKATAPSSMPPPHVLPIPDALRTRACAIVSRRVAPLPFVHNSVRITCDLIAAGMEALNAQATRTLSLKHRMNAGGRVQVEGLDRLLQEQGLVNPGTALILSGVLERAGITEPAVVPDRQSRRILRGTRLVSPWTWHIECELQKPVTLPTALSDLEERSSWQDLCPVCRTGMLNAVIGQRLFGIPATGFLLCTHCGAKFVPDDNNYRLVSIAMKKDPLWGRYLNTTMSPDAWEAIARELKSPEKKQPILTQGHHQQKSPANTREKNNEKTGGRLAIPVGDRTLYFTMLTLQYRQRGIHDLFSRNKTPLRTVIRLPSCLHLAKAVHNDYAHYLDVPVGFFLSELKGRKDTFYREFLNIHGDETFCRFRTDTGGIAAERGVFVVAVGQEIRATGPCRTAFSSMVNDELGWLSPDTCYRHGDPVRCRINALLCSHRKTGGIYIHPVGDDDEIAQIAGELNAEEGKTKGQW
jgi:hypothetical protein